MENFVGDFIGTKMAIKDYCTMYSFVDGDCVYDLLFARKYRVFPVESSKPDIQCGVDNLL